MMPNPLDWKTIRPLGQGGFGITTLIERDDDRYVLKRLEPRVSPQFQAETEALFAQEATLLKELGEHPQIPKLLDSGADEVGSWLLQEYIPGDNLEQLLQQRGAWPETKVVKLLRSLLPVLQTIHEHQIIHRDIKPANIIWWNQQYYLVDFGVSKLLSEAELRRTGTMIGSPVYAAPEQVLGKATFASDIYSLGVTCIHLLTDIPPFDLIDTGTGKLVWKDYLQTPISVGLGQVIDQMLEKGTLDRYPSAQQVLEDLDNLYQSPPGKPLRMRAWRSPWLRSAILLGLAIALNIGIHATSRRLNVQKYWQIIDQEKGVYYSPSRIRALQKLNQAKQSLKKIDLSEVYLADIQLMGADLEYARFINAKLSGALLSRTNLRGALLRSAHLHDANLSQANLERASLAYAVLPSSNLIGALLKDADLEHANLSGANLRLSNLMNADLANADLRHITLMSADLTYANLSGTNLDGAKLSGADLSNARLRDTNLNNAELLATNLSGVDLRGIQLSENQLKQAILCKTRLPSGEMSDRDCSLIPPPRIE